MDSQDMKPIRDELYDEDLARNSWVGSLLERDHHGETLGLLARGFAPIIAPTAAAGSAWYWRIKVMDNVDNGYWRSECFHTANDAVAWQAKYVRTHVLAARAAAVWSYQRGQLRQRIKAITTAVDGLYDQLSEIEQDHALGVAIAQGVLDTGGSLDVAWALYKATQASCGGLLEKF